MIAPEVGSERHLHTTGTLRLASFGNAGAKLEQNAKAPLQVRKSGGIHFTGRSRSPRAIYQDWIGGRSSSFPEEGWVNAGALCRALIDLSTKRFAVRYRRERVQGLERAQSKARLRLTTGIEVFDSLVLAAGKDANTLSRLPGSCHLD